MHEMKINFFKFLITITFLFIAKSTIVTQELSPKSIFDEVSKSVVVVLVADENNVTISQGSGVVINDDGVLVTNYHVYSGGKNIRIRQGYTFIDKCIIVGTDISKDILLIKIVGSNPFPKIKIGDSENLSVGQRVYAIGTPLGEENSMSEGIISGIRDKGFNSYIQITASISPGSSGGAVVNQLGELIGISSMSLVEGQNLNYAIPVSDILKVNILEQDKLTITANEYLNNAYSADSENKFEIAIFYYTKYLNIFPDSANIYLRRATDYYNLAQLQNCLKDYSMYIELKPSDCSGYNLRGSIYHQLGNNDLSYADLNQAISLDYDTKNGFSSCGSAYDTRGDIHFEMGRYEKALEDYEMASEKWWWGKFGSPGKLKEKIAKCKRMLGRL